MSFTENAFKRISEEEREKKLTFMTKDFKLAVALETQRAGGMMMMMMMMIVMTIINNNNNNGPKLLRWSNEGPLKKPEELERLENVIYYVELKDYYPTDAHIYNSWIQLELL